MAFRRKTVRKFKRRIKRSFKMYKRIRRGNNVVYKFTRISTYGNIDVDNTADYSNAYVFKLSDLPNYTEFTSLYDQYRITFVKFYIYFQADPLVNMTAGSFIGRVYTALDFDDSVVPSESDIQQMRYVRMHRPFGVIKRGLKPRCLNMMYNDGITTAYSLANRKVWLDCANPNITHYGLKVYINKPSGTYHVTATVQAKFYVQFKSPR